MKIHLIRHGQKESVRGNPALTKIGRTQATAVGEFFKEKKISHIIASPLTRTQETAQYIAKETGFEIQTDQRLIERANWDTDITLDEFIKIWLHASEFRDEIPSVGDSSRSAGQRLEAVVHELLPEHLHDEVIFVSHGGTITDFLRNIFSDEELLSGFYATLENLYATNVPECSITTVEVSADGSYSLVQLCDTTHLSQVVLP